MKFNRILALIIILCVVLTSAAPGAAALNTPDTDAAAVLVADLDSGNILYEKNMDAQRSPASLTKIMTVLLAVEAVENGRIQLEEKVSAPSDCLQGLDESSSTSGIVPGEVMTFKDLLYCAMVHSANESCNVIGSCLESSVGAFVDRMNERARQLGAVNTHFSDPNGLSDSDHYSTAYDLYLITREAVKHPLFMTICNTTYYQVPATNINGARDLYNSNALISSGSIYGDGYLYKGAKGIKTGYTSRAGYCLVSTAERDDIRLMVIVLGCGGLLNTGDSEYRNFTSSAALYDWAFDNFSYREVLKAGTAVDRISVRYAKDGAPAILGAAENVRILLPNDAPDPELQIHVSADGLAAPLAAGTRLGTADIIVDGTVYRTISIVNMTDIEMARSDYIRAVLKQTFSATWIKILAAVIVILAAGYFTLLIQYRKMRRKHLRERRIAAEKRKAAEELRRKELAKKRAAERTSAKTRPENAEDVYSQYYTRIEPQKRTVRELDAEGVEELIKSLGLDKKVKK